MKIIEIFDHTENLEWQHHGVYSLSSFITNDQQYIIQIEKKQLFGINDTVCAEISFFKNDDNPERAFSTTGDQSSSTRVYGAVLNGLEEQFKGYDCFYFTVERRHSETTEQFDIKNKIYMMMANRLSKKAYCFLYEKKSSVRTSYLITKRILSDVEEQSTGFRNGLKEAMNMSGLKFFMRLN